MKSHSEVRLKGKNIPKKEGNLVTAAKKSAETLWVVDLRLNHEIS